jgi:hypothetical protein
MNSCVKAASIPAVQQRDPPAFDIEAECWDDLSRTIPPNIVTAKPSPSIDVASWRTRPKRIRTGLRRGFSARSATLCWHYAGFRRGRGVSAAAYCGDLVMTGLIFGNHLIELERWVSTMADTDADTRAGRAPAREPPRPRGDAKAASDCAVCVRGAKLRERSQW